MGKTRTFRIGPHIWFILHYNDADQMIGLEEHDGREGGHLPEVANMPWEEMFVRSAARRVSGEDFQQRVEQEAQNFLKNDLAEHTVK